MGKRSRSTKVKKEPNQSINENKENETSFDDQPESKKTKKMTLIDSNTKFDACFYEEDEVNQNFICSASNHRLEDPRLLPCGDSICFKCVDLIKESDATESEENCQFKCPVCQEVHINLNKENLPRNKALGHLAQLKPKEIYRNKDVETLKTNLKQIQTSILAIQSNINDPARVQKEQFNSVRNDIDLATENAKKALDDMRDDLFEELKELETQCDNQKLNKSMQEDLDEVLEMASEFILEKNKYLRQTKLDDGEIQKSIEQAQKHWDTLNAQLDNVNESLIHAKRLKFIPTEIKLDRYFLGLIHYNNTCLPGLKKVIHIGLDLTKTKLDFDYLDSKQLSMLYVKNGCLTMQLYSGKNKLDREVVFFKDNDSIKLSFYPRGFVSSYNNFILAYVDFTKRLNFESHLFLYDIKLNKFDTIQINQYVECLTITDSKCYCIIKDKDITYKLQIYDMKLKAIRTYDSQRKSEPFCFSFEIDQIFVKDQKIYLLKKYSDRAIVVMDENTGLIVQTLPFEVNSFSILNNDILYFVNKQKDEICFAYLNGTIIKRSDMPDSCKYPYSSKVSKGALISKSGDILVYL